VIKSCFDNFEISGNSEDSDITMVHQ
jgi:hypothetical protein